MAEESVIAKLERLRSLTDQTRDLMMAVPLGNGIPADQHLRSERRMDYEDALDDEQGVLYDAAPALIAAARALDNVVRVMEEVRRTNEDIFEGCNLCALWDDHDPECPIPAAQAALDALTGGA